MRLQVKPYVGPQVTLSINDSGFVVGEVEGAPELGAGGKQIVGQTAGGGGEDVGGNGGPIDQIGGGLD